MKFIKDLSVKVTYTVGLGNLEVSEKVFKELNKIEKNGSIDGTGMDYPEAVEWLRNNIRERDCHDIEYTVELI